MAADSVSVDRDEDRLEGSVREMIGLCRLIGVLCGQDLGPSLVKWKPAVARH
jgi:hypothetical protein